MQIKTEEELRDELTELKLKYNLLENNYKKVVKLAKGMCKHCRYGIMGAKCRENREVLKVKDIEDKEDE